MNRRSNILFRTGRLALVLATGLVTNNLLANDFFGDLDTNAEGPTSPAGPFHYLAWVQQKIGYGYRTPDLPVGRDSAQLTQVESRLYGRFTWDWDAWQLRLAGSLDHDWLPDLDRADLWSGYQLNTDQRQQRRWRLREDDSYLSWQAGDWWIKGGYQTLAWGEAESLKVTDQLARRDQRWPGQADLEQLRLPVPALLIHWRQSLELVLLIDTPVDRQPAPLDEFDTLAEFRQPEDYRQPDIHLRSQTASGWALRWQHSAPGWDLRLLLANSYSPEPVLAGIRLSDTGATPRIDSIQLEQERQSLAGLQWQATRGNWVFKTEQAWLEDLPLAQSNPLADWLEKDQWRAMYALEYSGVRDLLVSGEITHSYTLDYQQELASDAWQTGYGLRLSYNLFNERLSLGAVGLQLNGNQGELLRLSANWEQSDRLSLGLTLVDYSAHADQQLYPYRHNDSLLLSLRWAL